ncbi:diguanylate cyclase domain-containing protein [Ruminococcus gauvreauii]|uniref:diguanylate cyclase domain-containing protein n=1 Tax=Ruminococcus gauvreauii TaxID=438033 RepID=UPI003983FE07
MSISVGISFAPENGITYEDLFLHADQALYASKHAGRNQYHFYESSMRTILLHHRAELSQEER